MMTRKDVSVSRHACAIAVVALLLPASRVAAADLRITDSRGTQVVVSAASVDYGGMLSDKENDGIRVLQGDGMVVLKWADVDTLKVTRKDDAEKPPRIEIEIALRNGKKVSAAFFRQGLMKLSGKT